MTRGVCCLLLLTLSILRTSGEEFSVFPEALVEESEEIAFQKLLHIEDRLKSTVEGLIKKVLPVLISSGSESDISPKCMGSLMKTLIAFKDMKLWAFKLVDASGKPMGGGTLSGLPSALGSYNQCLDVIIPSSTKVADSQPNTGQYCVIRIRPPLPPRPKLIHLMENVFPHINSTFKTEVMNTMKNSLYALYDTPFKLGLCVPSSCTKDDVLQLLNPIGKDMGLLADVETCEVKEGYVMDHVQLTIIVIFILITLLNVIATITYEITQVLNRRNSSTTNKYGLLQEVIECFSMRLNFEKLVSTKETAKRSLDCMNGIRYLSCTWVILGHAYLVNEQNIFSEANNSKTIITKFAFQVIGNSFLSVESFILISAILISYSLVKRFDSQKSFSPFISIIRRIIRLLPCVLLVIGVIIILPLFGSGPFFKDGMEDHANNCRQRWWYNALFISNFLTMNKMCLPHAWYLSTDLQIFILGIIYFSMLFRNKTLGKMFLLVMLISSMASSGIVTYQMNYPPTFLIRNIDLRFSMSYMKLTYLLPHVHMGVYAIGLYLGTFIARYPKIKLCMWTAVVGWLVAITSALAVVYAIYPWNNGEPYSQIEAILYSATQKTVWGASLAWVILACYAGRGGVITSFLSWPAFQPLVRLSYLLYLVHIPILMFTDHSKHGMNEMTNQYFVYNFFGALCCSHIAAALIRVLFESPIVQLEAMFFARLNKKTPSKAAVTNVLVVSKKDNNGRDLFESERIQGQLDFIKY